MAGPLGLFDCFFLQLLTKEEPDSEAAKEGGERLPNSFEPLFVGSIGGTAC